MKIYICIHRVHSLGDENIATAFNTLALVDIVGTTLNLDALTKSVFIFISPFHSLFGNWSVFLFFFGAGHGYYNNNNVRIYAIKYIATCISWFAISHNKIPPKKQTYSHMYRL